MNATSSHLSRFVSLIVMIGVVLVLMQGTESQAQNMEPTLVERLKAKAVALAILKELDPRQIEKEQLQNIADALILGIQYGNQAKQDEEAGYDFAHQKAAYDWGYQVGDPKTVRLARFFWEGVQLGVFAIGDFQQYTGEKTARWATVEALVGGNGEEYDVNEAYIEDIFDDIQIATDGAQISMQGLANNFQAYLERSPND